MKKISLIAAAAGVSMALAALSASAADVKPIRIGFVTFLSGPAAGPFGVPAKIAAEAIVESINSGRAPSPYNTKGFGGTPIELAIIDEAGGATKQVSEFRNLIERQKVDFVIGYIGSGDCLAIAPVAEELKKLTVFFDCGTPRVFEEGSYKYVFRTRSHATMDAVAAAKYLQERTPGAKTLAGINQNYAYGQDSWNDFSAAMKSLHPDLQVVTSQMPKFGAGQYGAEISTLLQSGGDILHSSLWGGDLEAFMLQANPRGLFKKGQLVLVAGEPYLHRLGANIPDGTLVGARGPNGAYAPDVPTNRWLKDLYKARTGLLPNYPAYSTAMAFLGLKAAYEKAKITKLGATIPMGDNKGVKDEMQKAYAQGPSTEDVVAAFEGITFDSPAGKVRMGLGKGHQAVTGTAYGVTKLVNNVVTLTDIKHYRAEDVQPPEGMTSMDWIKAGMKPAK